MLNNSTALVGVSMVIGNGTLADPFGSTYATVCRVMNGIVLIHAHKPLVYICTFIVLVPNLSQYEDGL